MNRIRMSWRQKLITTALLCLIVPSLATLAVTSLHTKNEFKKKAIIKAEQSLEVADHYVTNLTNDMISAMNSIQYDSEIITQLRIAWTKYNDEAGAIDFFSFKKITEKLDNFTFFRDKTYVTVLLPNGLYFTNYSTFNLKLSFLYEEPWLKRMYDDPINTTRWVGPQPNYVRSDAAKYPNLVSTVRTFQLYANSPNALIIISKPEGQFHQIFGKYEPDQIMMLKNEEGIIISNTDADLIGQTIAPSFVKGEDTLVLWRGTPYISVKHSLSFAGWSMQSLTDYDYVTGNIGSFINYLFILQIAFFVVFSMIMFYLLRQFTFPILRLSRTAGKVEDGNLDIRSHIGGTDEIGRLGLSFDRMLDRIQEMVRQIEMEQSRKRIAELELLQAQINPHFLFNILNSIRLRVMMKGEEALAGTIGSLSTLLRMTINRNNEFLPLHEEVATVEHYMKLMNFRHSEEMLLTVGLASDTLLDTVPRFTLQPLIENAYIHGLEQKCGEISITSRKQGGSLYIRIQDNGKGMSEEQLTDILSLLRRPNSADRAVPAKVSGIGLRNVHERLAIIYGSDYELDIKSTPGEGTCITLKIPLVATKEDHGHV
ncbi:sensor histidine kinase [Paenibacillaceae bacterium]|nr:sensor histidine kinase [Paenibacillaceae bacterium]